MMRRLLASLRPYRGTMIPSETDSHFRDHGLDLLREFEGPERASVSSFRRCLFGSGIQRRLDRSLGRCADVDAERALLTGNAIDRRLGDKIAVERNRALRVVIAGDRIVDLVR